MNIPGRYAKSLFQTRKTYVTPTQADIAHPRRQPEHKMKAEEAVKPKPSWWHLPDRPPPRFARPGLLLCATSAIACAVYILLALFLPQAQTALAQLCGTGWTNVANYPTAIMGSAVIGLG